MTIDWAALGVVSAVSAVSTLLFVLLLSGGIRLVSLAALRAQQGLEPAAARTTGYALLLLAAGLVLYGIYLIVPLFH
jgi:hypothetical protein